MADTPTTDPKPTTSFSAFAGRIFWMFLGPMMLLFLAAQIVTSGSGWLTGLDIAFFVVLAAMLLGRWLEFRGGQPQTASGEPATADHLRRYLLGAASIGLVVWAGANAVGNHWLGP